MTTTMTARFRRLALLPLAALLVLSAACSDATSFTAPDANVDLAGPAFAKASANDNSSRIVSQITKGDTTITVFVVGNASSDLARFAIGNSSRIDFPFSVSSICNPRTSSYGVGTWNNACSAATAPITITAKTWTNNQGRLVADFEPALRFVPSLSQSVMLTMRAQGFLNWRIDYCTVTGCVDESRSDASLRSTFEADNNSISRIIKHFSGYTVTAD